ncbi:hypothetical protein F4678DRAFT_458345 [Xylaria arbuscula]|nr:hypothetical protein F4678DRAFT_458345 [Xylaria arbuscula]
MGCCGSEDDYYTVAPYRHTNEKPHPSIIQQRPEQQHHRPQHYQPRHYQPQNYRPSNQQTRSYQPQNHRLQHRGPSREEVEKRQRQAQATAAARNYGWPTERSIVRHADPRPELRNRDSIIEPGLAGGLAAMPGSDFRAVYDPQRARQQQTRQPNIPQPAQRPPYYQQRFVNQQPARMPMMSASNMQNVRRMPPVVHQQPVIARKPVIQTTRPQFRAPQVARIVRRDSNGISECSDDDDDIRDLRNYTVSPLNSPDYQGPGRSF